MPIINDVEVEECKNFIPIYTEDTNVEINNCCTLTYTPCEYHKENCYFKQLQRLKKENEELKFYIDSYRQTWEVDKYRQALEEIKGIAVALSMNNWLQMNETARESIKLLQNKIDEVLR